MATTYDIAKKAGVSQATVSRVLNGSPAVSMETKQKVMEWVRKLDYQPNLAAQSLTTKQSYLIGLVIPDVTNPYYSLVLKAVEQAADLHGYNIVLCDSRGNLQKEKQSLNVLRRHQVAGVLLAPVDKEASLLNLPRQNQMPVIAITNDVTSLDYVCVSHQRGGMLAANHLLELGHTKFAFLGPPAMDDKFCGFSEALQSRNITCHEENMITLDKIWGEEGFNEIHKRMNAYLDRKTSLDVTALFAYNDVSAFVAARILQEKGYRVPGDIAIVGFDNTLLAEEATPPLTSIAQPVAEIGRLTIEMLQERIAEGTPDQKSHIILEPTLIPRESTRKTRVSD